MVSFKNYQCPICQADLTAKPRYPRYVCGECISRAVSIDGRPLEFFNTALSGGYFARYRDTEEAYPSRQCFIDGVPCRADEARFGGIVIQVKPISGDLTDALPEKVSQETVEFVEALIRRKVTTAVGIAVRLLHAMEARFGPEAREVLREMVESVQSDPRPNPGDPEEDLHLFCDQLDQACIGSHRWERREETTDKIAYRYSRCLWAEVFNVLNEPDLGYLLCAGDEPAVKAFNPALGFKRTRVLMRGDEECDHVFSVEDNQDE